MFFTAAEKPAGDPNANSTSPTGNSSGSGGPSDIGFYIYFYLHNAIDVLTILLNFLVTVMIIANIRRSFATPFYGLTAVLMVILFVVGAVSLVWSILFMGIGVRNNALDFLKTVTDLYTSYISVILIWLLGLNRMAIFTMPKLNNFLFTRNKMIFLMFLLTILMIFVCLWLYETIGLGTNNAGSATASNLQLLHIVNIVSYCIPLSSCLFYMRLYHHLRATRRESTIASTKETFSKAEQSTAAQGVVILVTYVLAMIVHIVMSLISNSGPIRLYMNGLQDIVESLPQLVIPISTIVYSKEAPRQVADEEDISASLLRAVLHHRLSVNGNKPECGSQE